MMKYNEIFYFKRYYNFGINIKIFTKIRTLRQIQKIFLIYSHGYRSVRNRNSIRWLCYINELYWKKLSAADDLPESGTPLRCRPPSVPWVNIIDLNYLSPSILFGLRSLINYLPEYLLFSHLSNFVFSFCPLCLLCNILYTVYSLNLRLQLSHA